MAGYAFASLGPRTYAKAPPFQRLVAVANNGSTTDQVETSKDGTSWASQSISPSTRTWSDVCYASALGLWCAVSLDGHVMTSPNGIVWTARTAASGDAWSSIVWSPGLGMFAAVAKSSGAIMTSPDGVTWTSRTSPDPTQQWAGVDWSPSLGKFLAVSVSGNSWMSSSDGVTWTATSWGPTIVFNANDVAWSPGLGLFVVVGTDFDPSTFLPTGNGVLTWDGTTWTRKTNGKALQAVCWSPGQSLFCAMNISGGNLQTSPDGTTWTNQTSAEANVWQDVCWSASLGLFIAVSAGGTHRVQTSPDGSTWTARTAAAANDWTGIAAAS